MYNYVTTSVSDAAFLPFITLRTTDGVVKKDLPPSDDTTSIDIDIPYGLTFDKTSQTTAYVSYSYTYAFFVILNFLIKTGCDKWILLLRPKSNFSAESSSLQWIRHCGIPCRPILE